MCIKLWLELLVHKRSETRISLDPGSGTITFTTPKFSHKFAVIGPSGDPDAVCPKYSLKVLDASDSHVVLRKVCPRFEYKPERFFKSVDYFLYDQLTASMRGILIANDVPKIEPSISRTAKGYTFEWKGQLSKANDVEVLTYRNEYARERSETGELSLVCTDLTDETGELETGSCEGGGYFAATAKP